MGLYVDPLTDPGPFLAAVVERAPIIFLGQWSPVPGETAVLLHPPLLSLFWWAAVVLAGCSCGRSPHCSCAIAWPASGRPA